MPPDAVQVRDAVESDLPLLQPFAQRTWLAAFAHSFDDAEEAQRHIESELSVDAFRTALAQDLLLLALSGETLIGYGQLGPPEFAGLPVRPGDLQLRRLYVEPEQHAQGVGSLLLDVAFARARAVHASCLWLEVWQHNQRAQRLYRRYGFETVAAQRYYHRDGTPLDLDYVMRARLR